jgi:hypothetical protein
MTGSQPQERAAAPLADRVKKARRESTCPDCGCPVRIGQRIAHCGDAWIHLSCAVRRQVTNTPDEKARPLP